MHLRIADRKRVPRSYPENKDEYSYVVDTPSWGSSPDEICESIEIDGDGRDLDVKRRVPSITWTTYGLKTALKKGRSEWPQTPNIQTREVPQTGVDVTSTFLTQIGVPFSPPSTPYPPQTGMIWTAVVAARDA
uniref:Uncharacterized protein n=1 Tax=Coccidioides posadasii RMSCC 3488 TaxID=454284 RepID=A0A0J6FSY6_COCPO|nr:hypothetical protein CPAG_09767 [Coccidioides posadasii RMSCC 3488]